MGICEEKKKQDQVKGFASLSSLVSNVDAAVVEGTTQAQETSPPPSIRVCRRAISQTHQAEPRSDPRPILPPFESSGGSSIRKWLFTIAIIIGIPIVFYLFGNTGAPNPSSSSRATLLAAKARIRPSEEQPSVGRNNVLSPPQIRYCLATKIRLDAAEAVIDNYDHSEVDRFNGYVNDYNSRCGAYRYRSGALESARREVEPYRSQLQTDGLSWFIPRAASAPRSDARTRSPQPPATTPDLMVQAIQLRLNVLGYEAGEPDGLYGERTRKAIKKFQQDNGIPESGAASAPLLEVIRGAIASAGSNPSG